MTYAIPTTVVQCIVWSCQVLGASAQVFSVPAEGAVSAMDTVTSRFMLPRALKALSVKTIWETRTYTAGTLLGLVAIYAVYYSRSPWRKLPPRPRGLPIIGNALQAMNTNWLISKDCKERFSEYPLLYSGKCRAGCTAITGEIMYLDAAGQPIIVLNSLKSTYELLERRATTYSGRPRRIMVQEILSQGLMFSLMGYVDR